MRQKLYKIASLENTVLCWDYIAADNYAEALTKIVENDEDFDYKYGDGFKITNEGEILI